MYPKLFKIPTTLAENNFWVLLIISGILSIGLYFLISMLRKKQKTDDKKSSKILFFIINVVFYGSVLVFFYTLLSRLIADRNSLDLNTYGFMLAIAFIVGIWLVIRKARELGLPVERYLDLSIIAIVSSLFGARLFYMLFEYSKTVMVSPATETAKAVYKTIEPPMAFFNDPASFITQLFDGGLVAYGGMVVAVLVSLYMIRAYKLPYGKTFDIFAPSIALGVMFARIGCNCAGCCFGSLTPQENPISINWFNLFVPRVAPVHKYYDRIVDSYANSDALPDSDFFHYVWPSQIMSALNGLIMFLILAYLYKHRSNLNWKPLIILVVLFIYSAVILWAKSFEGAMWNDTFAKLVENSGGKITGAFTGNGILNLTSVQFFGLIGFILFSAFNIITISLKKLKFNGIIFVFLMIFYATARYTFEAIRSDTEKFLDLYSASQLIGIAIMLIATITVVINAFFRKKPTEIAKE